MIPKHRSAMDFHYKTEMEFVDASFWASEKTGEEVIERDTLDATQEQPIPILELTSFAAIRLAANGRR